LDLIGVTGQRDGIKQSFQSLSFGILKLFQFGWIGNVRGR
jgi:hypothetical protein